MQSLAAICNVDKLKLMDIHLKKGIPRIDEVKLKFRDPIDFKLLSLQCTNLRSDILENVIALALVTIFENNFKRICKEFKNNLKILFFKFFSNS